MGGDGGSEEAALRVEFLEMGVEARGKESLHHGFDSRLHGGCDEI